MKLIGVQEKPASLSCMLDTQQIRAKKRLLMRATPRVLSNRIKGKAVRENLRLIRLLWSRFSLTEPMKHSIISSWRAYRNLSISQKTKKIN